MSRQIRERLNENSGNIQANPQCGGAQEASGSRLHLGRFTAQILQRIYQQKANLPTEWKVIFPTEGGFFSV
ncbi:hypothetical protein DVA76_18275 [Acinetobacter baumannii]|nr:hypothetical protein DVA76_18275 [Acinetobacter baumannii]